MIVLTTGLGVNGERVIDEGIASVLLFSRFAHAWSAANHTRFVADCGACCAAVRALCLLCCIRASRDTHSGLVSCSRLPRSCCFVRVARCLPSLSYRVQPRPDNRRIHPDAPKHPHPEKRPVLFARSPFDFCVVPLCWRLLSASVLRIRSSVSCACLTFISCACVLTCARLVSRSIHPDSAMVSWRSLLASFLLRPLSPPSTGKIYSINEGNALSWDNPTKVSGSCEAAQNSLAVADWASDRPLPRNWS
jgi:hypothetical protein